MLVSTIVPTRNRPLELKRALDAIARQTHPDMEVIVVDDGSGPESARHNRELAGALGPRARYMFLPGHNPRGSGPSYARNVGIAVANGELVAFCDDDDYWCDDEHIAVAVRVFSGDSSLDLVFANQQAHADGKLVRSVWLPRLVDRLALDAQSSYPTRRVSLQECLIYDFGHMNTCVFRKDLLRRVGGFWEALRYLEDMDLFVRAVDAARRVEYRHHTVSIHNIPDRTLQLNASTLLDENAKDIAAIDAANHLIQCCRSAEVRRYASEVAGYSYRHLAMAASKAKRDGAAFGFAKLALMWLPSLRWAAYTAFLGFKALLQKAGAIK